MAKGLLLSFLHMLRVSDEVRPACNLSLVRAKSCASWHMRELEEAMSGSLSRAYEKWCSKMLTEFGKLHLLAVGFTESTLFPTIESAF